MYPHVVFALAAALQVPAQPPAALPQPIARVDVRPAEFALKVGDTVRLSAVAYDSAGRPLPAVQIRWFASGGRFEGKVDSTGLVSAGATGTINVSAVATLAALSFFASRYCSSIFHSIGRPWQSQPGM